VHLESIQASLVNPFSLRLYRAVDVLVFNPPYVPTGAIEAHAAQNEGHIQGSWAGGFNGMQVTNKLLDRLDVRIQFLLGGAFTTDLAQILLSPTGRFYLVALKQNDIPDIIHRLSQQGMLCEVSLVHPFV
jgi:release factor glutamine methyltransferase